MCFYVGDDDPLYYATLWFNLALGFGSSAVLLRIPVAVEPGALGISDTFFDIDDAGNAVGGATTQEEPDLFGFGEGLPTDYAGARAVLLKQGQLTDLSPILGGFASIAYGISNSTSNYPAGLITGGIQLDANGDRTQGFVYDPQAQNLLLIPPIAGASDAIGLAINKSGVVAGLSGGHLITFNAGNQQLTDLQPGVDTTVGMDINGNGQIVANFNGVAMIYDPQSPQPAFTPIKLPPASTGANVYAINDAGDAVGLYATTARVIRAFIWNQNVNNGVANDLNEMIPANSGWILTQANDISDDGHIVGNGTLNGRETFFLLTPVVPPVLELKSIVLTPSTVVGGANSQGKVFLTTKVPLGQTATVTLGSFEPQVAKPLVASVTIPEGQDSSGPFAVRTFPIPDVPRPPAIETEYATIWGALGYVRYALLTVVKGG